MIRNKVGELENIVLVEGRKNHSDQYCYQNYSDTFHIFSLFHFQWRKLVNWDT